MSRVGPTFGSAFVTNTTVNNNWGVNGDTPAGFRIYTNPFNYGQSVDVDLSVIAYTWSNLPPGTLMRFDVACIYEDPYELYAADFMVRTAGSPTPPPTPPPAPPPAPPPPGRHTVNDLYALAKAVNEVTLGRMEGETREIRSFLDSVNGTTLGRMEAEIKDIRSFLNAINGTTLGRMEGEIQSISGKPDRKG